MPQNSVIEMKLPSLDELFSSEETRQDAAREKVMELPLSEIDDFPGHPFKVRMDEEMLHMVESVKQYGILLPALVRPKESGAGSPCGGYEMIAGHRRKMACELAGLETMPCIVRELSRDEAAIAMVDSNLQREHVLPSEKAFAYKIKLEAIKRQGKRTDLTSPQLAAKSGLIRSDDKVAEKDGISGDTVQRYIDLTRLIPELLEMVDNEKLKQGAPHKRMAFTPAVELSNLSPELQVELRDAIEANECTPSLSQAQRLKKAAQEERLDRNGIDLVLSEEKPQQSNLTLKSDKLKKYFPKDRTPVEMEKHIFKALDFYERFYTNYGEGSLLASTSSGRKKRPRALSSPMKKSPLSFPIRPIRLSLKRRIYRTETPFPARGFKCWMNRATSCLRA